MKFNLGIEFENKIIEKGYDPGFISFLIYYFLGESQKIELVPSNLTTDAAVKSEIGNLT